MLSVESVKYFILFALELLDELIDQTAFSYLGHVDVALSRERELGLVLNL